MNAEGAWRLARPLLAWLAAAAALSLLTVVDHNLANGTIVVPPDWQAYEAPVLVLLALGIAGLSPQVARLKANVLEEEPRALADVLSVLNGAPAPPSGLSTSAVMPTPPPPPAA